MKKDHEHHLQTACVGWFRIQYQHLAMLLFAVPNGGARNEITCARLKDEDVTAGVADLLLLVPNGTNHGLAIEMKTRTGRQSESQKMWQAAVEAQGYRYEVVRDVLQFVAIIGDYMKTAGRPLTERVTHRPQQPPS